MNELKIYENMDIGKIRVIQLNGKPVFVAKDVTDILGYQNSSKAILSHVDPEDRGLTSCYTLGGIQQMSVINESGLYSLILSSKLDNAKKFKRWVTSEVLPSIRNNDGYIGGQENLSDEELLSKALMVANNKIIERDKLILSQKPKVLFADSVIASNKCILIRELAKYLNQNYIDVGEKRLFQIFRKNGYLISKCGSDYNAPTQKSMDLKLFEIKKTIITHTSNDYITTSITPMVTGRGQVYFMNKFLKGELI